MCNNLFVIATHSRQLKPSNDEYEIPKDFLLIIQNLINLH